MKSKEVLIVDNNDLNRRLLENLIGEFYNFKSAASGIEAVDKASKIKFDMILMDIQMPYMDGITAAKTIWRKSPFQCPIVAMSPYSADSAKNCFLEMGFLDLISKPVRPKELLSTLGDYFQSKRDAGSPALEQPAPLDKQVFLQLSKYNSSKTLMSLYIDFLNEFDQLMSSIDAAFEEKNQQLLIENLHIMKGNSGTMGANVIFSLSTDADKSARSVDWKSLQITLKKLKNERTIFENYLKDETTLNP